MIKTKYPIRKKMAKKLLLFFSPRLIGKVFLISERTIINWYGIKTTRSNKYPVRMRVAKFLLRYMFMSPVSRLLLVPKGTVSGWTDDNSKKTGNTKSKVEKIVSYYGGKRSERLKPIRDGMLEVKITIKGKTKSMRSFLGEEYDNVISANSPYVQSTIAKRRQELGIPPKIRPKRHLGPKQQRRYDREIGNQDRLKQWKVEEDLKVFLQELRDQDIDRL